jgi:ABC-type nitrate/sulfonate/bicarbonate transport system substrate-binding protein
MPLNRPSSARVRKLSLTFLLAAAFAVALIVTPTARAAEKSSFKVAWSIYVGWMPWDYAQSSGILKKWADKYGIKIQHGHADHPGGGRRGFDGPHRGRLLQRQ